MSEENTTFIRCSRCGKSVSHIFSWPDDVPFIVRAWVECPECLEKDDPEQTRRILLDAVEAHKTARRDTPEGEAK